MQVGDTLAPFGAGNGSVQTQGKSDLGKEDFLRLLTTQLSNQDPLNPMDNTAFVSQMAEFSGLEQMMNMSESISQLAVAQAVGNGTQMVGLIGKEVAYTGDTVAYQAPGDQSVGLQLDAPADTVTVTVYDAQGNLVKTIDKDGPLEAGDNELVWDGTDNNGNPVESGDYSFKVSAHDADGERVGAHLRLRGTVTGVTYASGFPELLIGNQKIPVGQIIEVFEPGADSGSAATGEQPAPLTSTTTAQPYAKPI